MATIHQVTRGGRRSRNKYCRTKNLHKSPQRKGTCTKIIIIKPKKPNSAQRKIAKIRLTNGKFVRAAIPGQGHNLQQYSVVMVRGGRVRDIPGIHYKIIRGVYDFTGRETFERMQRRSKFGIAKPQEQLLEDSQNEIEN